MAVLERSELEASPLADLHAIADQLGLDGFRRLRKAELIDAILGERGGHAERGRDAETEPPDEREQDTEERDDEAPPSSRSGRRRGGRSASRSRRSTSRSRAGADAPEDDDAAAGDGGGGAQQGGGPSDSDAVADGVVELLGNGSAFLRVSPPDPSDDDVYVSAAQVRRCELVSGDRVSGPVRTPRRSERYPSLVRIETINGTPADSVAGATRYDDLPAAYPSERLALDAKDATLEAIEWLTPIGRGSRAVIVGAPRAGKSETLRSLLSALNERGDVDLTLVLAGARPEEIAQWQDGALAPAAALSFAASADSQGQAVERAIDAAKRIASRGGDAVVLIDSLDGLHPAAARKALAAARNLRDAGSLTVIATASRPFGGETTVIALDVALTSTGRQPILDLLASGTLKAELLVGEDGARAIAQARATALEGAG